MNIAWRGTGARTQPTVSIIPLSLEPLPDSHPLALPFYYYLYFQRYKSLTPIGEAHWGPGTVMRARDVP